MYNHQLDTFIQAADAGSFPKAAEALFISSTAVMKQIDLLEGALDVQLFVRTPRGLMLTDAGKSYCQDAKYMIRYAKDARVRPEAHVIEALTERVSEGYLACLRQRGVSCKA